MSTEFHLADQRFMELFKEELKNHDGTFLKNIYKFNGKHWVVSDNEERLLRDKAVYMIGKGLVNIPDMKILTQEESTELNKLGFIGNARYMIRLVQDYELNELPLSSLNSATAGQLVFCTLIRKRDDHEFNWSYVHDIPVFYDNHVAFALDPGKRDLQEFFSSKGPGEAGEWKVNQVDSFNQVKSNWRNPPINPESKHCVYDIEEFKSETRRICHKIVQRIVDINFELKEINISINSGESLVDFLSFTTINPELTVQTLLSSVLS